MMWTRIELKALAKEALQRNYWRIVLVSFLSLLFCFTGGHHTAATISDNRATAENTYDAQNDLHTHVGSTCIAVEVTETYPDQVQQESSVIDQKKAQMVGFTIFIIIALLALVFLYILQVLLVLPFQVGINRFMIKSIDDRAKVREVAYGFDHSYKNVVKTMFHYDIRIFLWSLLFIIPGFYKQYQYRMVPYILAEHPDMDYREVLQRSSDLMNGHKWKAFVLDLSFIPWHILGIITCFMVELFYVAPYQYLTCAALYRRLCGIDKPLPEQSE